MKTIITSWLLLFMAMMTIAQPRLIPGKNSSEKKWIKSGAYQMTWYICGYHSLVAMN